MNGLPFPILELFHSLKHLDLEYIVLSHPKVSFSSRKSCSRHVINCFPCVGDLSRNFCLIFVITCIDFLCWSDASRTMCVGVSPVISSTNMFRQGFMSSHSLWHSLVSKSKNMWHGLSLMTS